MSLLNDLSVLSKKVSAVITVVAQEAIDAGENLAQQAETKYKQGVITVSKKLQGKAAQYTRELKKSQAD